MDQSPHFSSAPGLGGSAGFDLTAVDLDGLCRALRESNPEPATDKTEELASAILNKTSEQGIPKDSLASVLQLFAEAAKLGIPQLELRIRNEQAIDPNLVAVAISGIQSLREAAAARSSDWGTIGKLKVDTSCIIEKSDLEASASAGWELSSFGQRLTNLSANIIAFVVAPELLRGALRDLGRILADDLNQSGTDSVEAKERNNAVLAIVRVLDQCDKPRPHFPGIRYGVERLSDYFSARVDAGTIAYSDIEPCMKALEVMKKSCVLVGFSFDDSVSALGRAKIVDCFYSLFEKHLPAKWGIALFNSDSFTASAE